MVNPRSKGISVLLPYWHSQPSFIRHKLTVTPPYWHSPLEWFTYIIQCFIGIIL